MYRPQPVVPDIGWQLFIRWSVFIACLPLADVRGDKIDFQQQVRPILTEHCIRCHGPDASERQADFRLDTLSDATADLGGHAGIVPGKIEQSEVMRRIVSADPDERMPPPDDGDALTSDQIAVLRQWIAEGAHYARHWAYLPVRSPRVPALSDELAADATDIDRFIWDALQRKGLKLSPPLKREALLRRATFDLTGLPPLWEDVEAFVSDTSPDAFAKVVDRLLESPHYGERWGRHWLDIARYADTHGGGAIGFKKFAFSYTYRDYVIDAFNRDLPYDRFITEQLAADQLQLAEHDAALAALGFLTVGRQYPNHHDVIDDRIDVVTRGLLGLTVACARCHDHKYDAIPTADYYALYATLAPSSPPTDLPVLGEVADAKAREAYQAELLRRQFRYDETVREQSEVLRHRLRMQVGEYLRELASGTPEQDLSTIFLSYRTDDLRPLMIEAWRKYLASLTEDDPVFGPWHQLAKLPEATFHEAAQRRVNELEQANGDLSKLKFHQLATQPPRWNPRVLQAIKTQSPRSLGEVADAYGKLFSEVQEAWLENLLSAAQEARQDTEIVPDQDPRHTAINSAVDRQLRYHLYGPNSPTMLSDEVARTLLNRPIHDHANGLQGAVHELHLAAPGSPPRAMSLVEQPNPPLQHVFRRGNPIDRGGVVPPRFLSALSTGDERTFADGQRRLGLATAIVDPQNPLTRRVIVNWVWQRHFGLGLVRTADDFGTRGEPPTHPELLDYLAQCLLHDHWSLKRLHRRIMLSQVYQQSALEDPAARSVDPQNHLWWRMPRRRLEWEAMRDAMLAVAGRLDGRPGGRPFDLFAEPFITRRSVYGFVNRDVIPSLFSTFDMADPSVCVAKRPQTTVPQQTLFALNSEFIQEQATHLACRAEVAHAADDRQRIRALYQCAFSRTPRAEEVDVALAFVQSRPASSENVWQQLAHVLLAANEFVFVD